MVIETDKDVCEILSQHIKGLNPELQIEKYFMGLAQKVGCKISQETIQEERYYKKPLSERIALAKKIVEGMEK